MRVRTRRIQLALAAAALLVGAACSSDDASTDPALISGPQDGLDAAGAPAGGSNVETAGSADAPAGETAEDLSAAVAQAVGPATPASPATSRALARTARLEVQVADIEQAAARIRALVARVGGFVANADIRGGENGFGVLTLRLPATQLDAVVDELGELADAVLVQQIGTEDLTDQLTDTSTRIANLTALEQELRILMADIRAKTGSAQELLVVFGEVNDVRLQIERLEAQQAGLADRVALATVTVDLQPTPTDPLVLVDENPSTVSQAWQATRDAFGEIGDALIWIGVTIVPVGLALLVPLVLLVRAGRRWGARAWPTASTPTSAVTPPAPTAP